jgi:hypothetical protein
MAEDGRIFWIKPDRLAVVYDSVVVVAFDVIRVATVAVTAGCGLAQDGLGAVGDGVIARLTVVVRCAAAFISPTEAAAEHSAGLDQSGATIDSLSGRKCIPRIGALIDQLLRLRTGRHDDRLCAYDHRARKRCPDDCPHSMTLKLLPLFLLQPAGPRLIHRHDRPVVLALAMCERTDQPIAPDIAATRSARSQDSGEHLLITY